MLAVVPAAEERLHARVSVVCGELAAGVDNGRDTRRLCGLERDPDTWAVGWVTREWN